MQNELLVRIFGTSNSSDGFKIFLKTKADCQLGYSLKGTF